MKKLLTILMSLVMMLNMGVLSGCNKKITFNDSNNRLIRDYLEATVSVNMGDEELVGVADSGDLCYKQRAIATIEIKNKTGKDIRCSDLLLRLDMRVTEGDSYWEQEDYIIALNEWSFASGNLEPTTITQLSEEKLASSYGRVYLQVALVGYREESYIGIKVGGFNKVKPRFDVTFTAIEGVIEIL